MLRRNHHACTCDDNISGRRECCKGFSVVLVAWMLRGCGCRGELSGDGRSSALSEGRKQQEGFAMKVLARYIA